MSFWIKYLINPFAREDRFMPSNTDGAECILSLQLLWYQQEDSQNGWGWKAALKVIWPNPPCSSRSTWSHLPRTMSFWISPKIETPRALFNLCQHSVTLTVQQLLLMLRQHLLCFALCPSPLVLSLDTSDERLALSSLYSPFRYLYKEVRSPLMSVSVYHGRPGTSKKYHAQSKTCFVKNITCFWIFFHIILHVLQKYKCRLDVDFKLFHPYRSHAISITVISRP